MISKQKNFGGINGAVGFALGHLGGRRQTRWFQPGSQTGRVRGDANRLGSHTHNVRGNIAT